MLIVLKIGGSAITKKAGFMQAEKKTIGGACKAISSALRKKRFQLIIVHGAGSFGHPHVLKHGIKNGVRTNAEKLGFADTHYSVSLLSGMLVKELVCSGVPAVSLPPTAIVRQNSKRISSFEKKTVEDFLSKGFVPVLYGDVVLDSAQGGSVVSGDQLVSYLSPYADKVILAGDVDGIFDSDPKKNKRAKLFKKILREDFASVLEKASGSLHKDVTGGMKGKLEEIERIGAPVFVVNARKPERLLSALLGTQTIGTEILV